MVGVFRRGDASHEPQLAGLHEERALREHVDQGCAPYRPASPGVGAVPSGRGGRSDCEDLNLGVRGVVGERVRGQRGGDVSQLRFCAEGRVGARARGGDARLQRTHQPHGLPRGGRERGAWEPSGMPDGLVRVGPGPLERSARPGVLWVQLLAPQQRRRDGDGGRLADGGGPGQPCGGRLRPARGGLALGRATGACVERSGTHRRGLGIRQYRARFTPFPTPFTSIAAAQSPRPTSTPSTPSPLPAASCTVPSTTQPVAATTQRPSPRVQKGCVGIRRIDFVHGGSWHPGGYTRDVDVDISGHQSSGPKTTIHLRLTLRADVPNVLC
mmetsp:Transcript_36952/g.70846  ORF Transcript_36952/g.70846 Transcript_36952/m.70846 type:complete len:327 (-) Transcript_36952:508-1488(-)